MDEINDVIDPHEVAAQKNTAVAVNGGHVIYSIHTEILYNGFSRLDCNMERGFCCDASPVNEQA